MIQSYIHIYIYVYMCVCVRAFFSENSWKFIVEFNAYTKVNVIFIFKVCYLLYRLIMCEYYLIVYIRMNICNAYLYTLFFLSLE